MIELPKPKFQLGEHVYIPKGRQHGYITECCLTSPPIKFHYFVSYFDEVGKPQSIGRGMLPEEEFESEMEHRERRLQGLQEEVAAVIFA